MVVTITNRQRRHKLDRRAISRLARQAAEVIGSGTTVPVVQTTQKRTRETRVPQDLSIVFVSDAEMARHNEQFHHVTGPTDILTFDYGTTGELIISVDHAHSQARRYRTKPSRELALYVVHGLLHLAGYDDRTAAQRRKMRAAERRVLTTRL